MISNYEKQYISILKDIYENGYADGTNERTGIATKRIPCAIIKVDLEKEFPILKSKKVFAKTALKEILWIWQAQSNNIQDLDAHIWDEWADGNGAIGMAYGAQVRRPVTIFTDPVNKTPESFRAYKNQTEFILEYLREFPNGRWGNVTLWNTNDLAMMNLVPCCHTITWNLDGGRLNCVLDQRSGDFPKGVPFNTTQYAMLTMLFAKDLGVKPGILLHVIADAHIYANQMEGVREQLAYYDVLECLQDNKQVSDKLATAAEIHNARAEDGDIVDTETLFQRAMTALGTEPRFMHAPDQSTKFFEVDVNKCAIVNYNYMGKVDFGKTAV